MSNKKDIQSEEDIQLMVNSFYDKVNKHHSLSYFFNEYVKIDWKHHLPKMYDFWSSLLLGTMRYSGQPFPKHLALPLKKENFDDWLALFFETVDEHFSGPVADEAKIRASNIARIFISRMGLGEPVKN
ncbi:MAG: group III truncated hemoglobin [Cytophagaceae bacterium]|nr:group III truncated hemoglobin [Cytophagaceae bacterium]